MSNILLPGISEPPLVLVRGYGDEPRKLLAGRVRGRLVEVISLDKTASICVPAVDVFNFNDELFGELVAAVERGDTSAVRSLWKEAKGFSA